MGSRHRYRFSSDYGNSVLNLVEVPNQMAKEIGYKGWLEHGGYDFDRYPKVDTPSLIIGEFG